VFITTVPITCSKHLELRWRVFITAVPITKLFAWGGGGDNGGQTVRGEGGGGEQWRTCATRDYEPRPVWTSLPVVFITAVPNTKLCAWGEEDSGGHVL
jgi:hypothetical protein